MKLLPVDTTIFEITQCDAGRLVIERPRLQQEPTHRVAQLLVVAWYLSVLAIGATHVWVIGRIVQNIVETGSPFSDGIQLMELYFAFVGFFFTVLAVRFIGEFVDWLLNRPRALTFTRHPNTLQTRWGTDDLSTASVIFATPIVDQSEAVYAIGILKTQGQQQFLGFAPTHEQAVEIGRALAEWLALPFTAPKVSA